METVQLKGIIEAALLAYGQPLGIEQLREIFEEFERPDAAAVRKALTALAEDCEGRPMELVEVASGWRLQVRSHFAARLSKLWQERPTRYSRALLETLALIAYRQPITRGEIENIRGVAVSSNIIKTLEEREWIRTVGHRDVPGKPELFGTTRAFLDYFNLKSLDELPPLAEIRDLSDFDPQLGLAPVAIGDAADEAGVDGEGAATLAENEEAHAESPAASASDVSADEPAADETDAGGSQHETISAEAIEPHATSETIEEHDLADEGDTTTTSADTAPAPTEHTP